ncbi:hypothetical protein LUZ62_085786 [Rhynchospora pubera]|uniref:La-related protein 6B n=1 Tax=Rhynchospora pubera TaxID=906938 RepID=A0AAV8C7L4_9POAL|nr:hypothetical protein LUZ62_085786 [Rhynchospora pubera]
MAQEMSPSDQKSQSLEASAEPELSRTGSSKRLNAKAPEFVPRAPERVVVPIHHHPHQIHVFHPGSPGTAYYAAASPQFEYYAGFVEHEVVTGPVDPDPTSSQPGAGKEGRDAMSDEVIQKITKQVEYYFSDINLATTEHLMRFISKDPEGYVPINIIAAFKKIKALIQTNSQLATALRASSKLVVSDDGKKVKRLQPFTEADMEELQSRIVVAENLPEDHCYQNLMKVFSAVGSVKTIRTCYPQTSNGTTPATNRSAKLDMLFANKLHAFVEYETLEDAEKAITELNDERNWRSGLRVRLLQGCIKSGGMKGKKDGEEEDGSTSSNPPSNEKSPNPLLIDESSPTSPEASHDNAMEEGSNEKDLGNGGRRGKGVRGRGGKSSRGRGHGSHTTHHHHHHNNNNNHNHRAGTSNSPASPPLTQTSTHAEQAVGATKQPPGPRMPDGTRGFTMGRGKPLTQAVNAS